MAPIHIIISGASSVGKSTLVDECIRKFRLDRKLKQYHFKPMHEVARAVLRRLNITGTHLQKYIQQQNVRQFASVQEKIIHEQLLNFDNEKQNNYLSDRSGFDALAYVHCYFNNEQAADSLFQTPEFPLLIQQCVGGLIFVIQPQEQLRAVNDNMRIVPNYDEQVRYTECLKIWYERAGLPYFVIVDLDMTKRIEFIEQHINGHFHWLPPQMSIPLSLPFHLSKQNRHRTKIDIAAQPTFDHSYIRRIHVLDPQNVQISYEQYDKNRLIEKYDPSCLNNKFVSVLLDRQLTNVFVQNILVNGISINGEEFNFIGYSNSQLKSRSCYLYAGSTDEIQQILDDNGDFHKIKTISKRSARIGLLFSSCTPTIHIESQNIIEIDDVERNDYTFTDGCGIIGRHLAKQIVPYLTDFKKPILTFEGDSETQENTFPCAYQIRYQGYKGVLMVNNDDKDDCIQVRPSMKKFTGNVSTCLYVCDDGYSGPKLGFIAKQFIMLLSGLKISDEVFLRKQEEFFQEIQLMCTDMNVALKYCLYYDRIDLIYHLLSNNIESIQSELHAFQKKSMEAIEKLKMPITKSRLAFGVCDPYGVLKPGQCYFRPTFNGRQFMFNSKICFVAKSPSYHLGDIRVLKLTSCKELEHLYDVLVFPTEGKRPHPNEIAGSDLDGDKYLICWDDELIPKGTSIPMDYTSTAKAKEPACITRADIIAQFADAQKNNQSGTIDAYYNYWANLLGVNSTQCRRLAELFSAAVDAPKTGEKIRIPPELRSPRPESQQNSIEKKEFVWMKMLAKAKEFKQNFEAQQINQNITSVLSKQSLLNLFFERRNPTKYNFHNTQSFSEYNLIITTIRWCNEQENSQEILNDFIYLFDFSQLTMAQKQNIELSLQVDRSHLYSILNKSKMLSNEMIQKYHFTETPLSWRLYYVSPRLFNMPSETEQEDTLEPIMYVLKNNDQHERTLINISINDTVTLVLEVSRNALTVEPNPIDGTHSNRSEVTFQIVPGMFNAYFESKLFSVRRKFIPDINYYVKISKQRIQIYEKDPGNSFIVFMFDGQQEQYIISVDLTRFDRNILRERNHPKVNKHHYAYFEIFVLSLDQEIASSYYPIISYHDEEYYTQNYFNEQLDHYEYVEYLTEQEQKDEEKYQNEQKQYEEKRCQLISRFENIAEQNVETLIDEFMAINDTEYLQKIWNHLQQQERPMIDLAEKLIEYFYQQIQSMLNGSRYRPSIDEQWFYNLLLLSIESQKPQVLQKIIHLIKKMNGKLKDKSQPSYLPFLGRIMRRLVIEHFDKIQLLYPINNEFLYNLYLALILGNNHNTNEINLTYLMEIHELTGISLTLKQLCHLIQSCTMVENSEMCLKFIEFLSTMIVIDENQLNSSTIDYILKFLSIIIRATVYDIDEINRRIKMRREMLIQNGETIVDLKATLAIRKTVNQESEPDDQQEIEECMEPIFNFQHYRDEKIPSHHFNIGDAVALIDQQQLDNYSVKQDEKPPLRLFYQAIGTVQSVHPLLSIKFTYWPLSLTNINCLNRKQVFRLERLPNFVTLNRSIDAMGKIVDNNEEIAIKPFLNLTDNVERDQLQDFARHKIRRLAEDWGNNSEYNNANLNNSQRDAIKRALENRLTLIQGPPGTGKTETSAWIIHLWLKEFYREGEPILICAETHQAVDNLTRRLLKYQSYRIIRYSEPRTVSPDLHEYTMQRQIELLRRENSKPLYGPPKIKELREVISKCQILCMSCSGVGILEKSLKFPFILIDEASQITEPNILIPLTRITDQIVLVGDQKQLPPIIKMAEAKELLERSFFQRLLENLQIESIMLDTQYRMHPALIEFPSRVFYNGLLKSGVTPDQRPTPREIQFVNKTNPLMFVDVDQGNEKNRGSNIYNENEVRLVCQTIQALLPRQHPDLSPSDIGVITPYTKQVKEIVEQLSRCQIPKGVEIRTVDGFQGREKTIIIISLVRSNDENEIGFLINQQRMNVLLTRAKCAMIVFGNKRTLKSNDLWKHWIESVPNISSTQFVSDCLTQNQNNSTTNQHHSQRGRGRGRGRR